MKSIKTLIATAALAISAIVVNAAPTTNNETLFATISGYSGGIPVPCSSTYYGKTFMTNSSGGLWIIPPSGTQTGTITDMSGYPYPYQTCILVQRRSDLAWWESTNSVTFPATNSSYSISFYVQVPYPANTNKEAIQAQLIFQ